MKISELFHINRDCSYSKKSKYVKKKKGFGKERIVFYVSNYIEGETLNLIKVSNTVIVGLSWKTDFVSKYNLLRSSVQLAEGIGDDRQAPSRLTEKACPD